MGRTSSSSGHSCPLTWRCDAPSRGDSMLASGYGPRAGPYPDIHVSAVVVLRLLSLAATATGRQTVAGIVQVDGPSTVRAAVTADARLLADVVHPDHLLAHQSNTARRQSARPRPVFAWRDVATRTAGTGGGTTRLSRRCEALTRQAACQYRLDRSGPVKRSLTSGGPPVGSQARRRRRGHRACLAQRHPADRVPVRRRGTTTRDRARSSRADARARRRPRR